MLQIFSALQLPSVPATPCACEYRDSGAVPGPLWEHPASSCVWQWSNPPLCCRNRLESNAEHWTALLLSLRELFEWVIRKDTELTGLGPIGGDVASLQKQLVSIAGRGIYPPDSYQFMWLSHWWRVLNRPQKRWTRGVKASNDNLHF